MAVNKSDNAAAPQEGRTEQNPQAAPQTAPQQTEQEVQQDQRDQREKTVKIRIPKMRADQEDVFVSVNNRTWLIKRGVEVEVPECVAEVLRHQEEMLEEAMRFEQSVKNG